MNKDNQIISKYIDNNSIKKNCQYWNHIDTEDQIYIKDKFKHIENIKLSECLYMILHHLDNRPLCPICNKEIKQNDFHQDIKHFVLIIVNIQIKENKLSWKNKRIHV